MAVLKFILVILLCIPLVFFIWKMFLSLVNDLDQQNKYMEKLRKKKEKGRRASRSEKGQGAEKRSSFTDRFKEKSSETGKSRDRDSMRNERIKRRGSYQRQDRDYSDDYSRRPEPPKPPKYGPYDYERQAEERDRGFKWQ